MKTRREILGAGAALLAAASSGSTAPRTVKSEERAREQLDVLFLGGTGFIGPHQIEHALERGHRITMFNRGRKAGLYGDAVEELVGDRDPEVGEGLAALTGTRTWDVVVDNSGYVPRHVQASAELLNERVHRYLYVSTVSVYDYSKSTVMDRDGALHEALAPEVERVTGATYGPLKAECDRIVRRVYGERATVVRPCYIVGPGDTSDRFTYWVERLHRGGDVVCPAGPDTEAQWIDVRDLCHWIVRMFEDETPGAFNGAGPASAMSNEQLMWALRAFSAAPTRLHWPTHELLDELKHPSPMFDWSRDSRHTDASAAVAAGLTYRSLAETVRDIHTWWLAQSAERRARPRNWATHEQEAALIARL